MWKLAVLLLTLVAAPVVLAIWPQLVLKAPVAVWIAWGGISAVVVLNWSAMREAGTKKTTLAAVKYADVAAGLGVLNLVVVLGVLLFVVISSGAIR